MVKYFSAHLYAAIHALKLMRQALLGAFFSITVIAIALALPVSSLAVIDLVARSIIGDHLEQEISFFLTNTLTEAQITHVQQKADEKFPGVWRFIPADEALAQIVQQFGIADLANSLAENPLPHTLIVGRGGELNYTLAAIEDEIKAWPEVETYRVDSAWIDQAEAILLLGKEAVWVLAIVLLTIVISVIFNTVRLHIAGHAAEIEVELLIGATTDFVRRPLLYLGAMQGFIGGVFALLFFSATLLLFIPTIETILHQYGFSLASGVLSIQDGVNLVILGTSCGLIGAWLSVAMTLAKQN